MDENTTPAPDEEEMTTEEFYATSILLSLARIYDALLVQIAQKDDATAASLQEQHINGKYLFPTLFNEEDTGG